MDETVLTGGGVNAVSRVGATVRRPAGPWAPAVHALLRELRAAGITEVPEPHGFDEQGREVLGYVEGVVAHHPLPGWLWEPAVLDQAGALLRRVHDASVPLVGAGLPWGGDAREPAEVICHNDVAPHNMAFVDGELRGLFDFDTAAPGPRLWDLAYLAYRVAPLAEDSGPGAPVGATARMTRLDRLVAAYGVPFPRADVLAAVAARLDALAEWTGARAEVTGDATPAGHAAMYRRDAARVRAAVGS
ncbi:phosphotransferase [Cellulomonas sp. C5510]|uniref:phosphotransferase n=1 Tax=Cellulomonas sp. C5510 TaxID=2871170 RepID=UPI001C9484A2|nr:phosphotransferase [Cellulomonas sp. C5510]QZN87177.1 phosphotransferase [Cellulomonas sp. C5510]